MDFSGGVLDRTGDGRGRCGWAGGYVAGVHDPGNMRRSDIWDPGMRNILCGGLDG